MTLSQRHQLYQLYRVFPWDPSALTGHPFSPDFVPTQSGSGRFDLRHSAVWYLAESADHAVAEVLQGFRGRRFHPAMLRRFEHSLALLSVDLPASAEIVNLDDPAQLVRLRVAPSMLASGERERSQEVAERAYDDGADGLRWWSKLDGDWHTVVVFLARVPVAEMTLSEPVVLSADHPAVRRACRALAIPSKGP